MTREEIISGLEFTVDMFLFDPDTGETYDEPINDLDKTTIDACNGAIEFLKQEPKTGHWINGNSTCPCCGESKFKDLDADIWADWKPKYCPNCGAKMVEPQNLKYADNDTMMPAT